MAFHVAFERCPTYIHATVTGDNTRESVLGYMETMRNECQKQDCFRVLIEEDLEGQRLGFLDVFTLIIDGVRNYVGTFRKMAYVDKSKNFEMGKFAETVAVNRGIPVAVFQKVDDARDWLLQD